MTHRFQSIDLLRGIALLGLPTMNIIVFSMPVGAYLNPTLSSDSGLLNQIIFSFFYLFADQKFMGMFSVLFGASVLLLADKNNQKGTHAWPYHYSRSFWLIVIGFLHAWFLWEGDVLMYYGIIALILYPFKYLNLPLLASITAILLGISAYMTHYNDISAANFGEKQRAELVELYQPTAEQQQQRKTLMLGSHADTVSEIRKEFTEENNQTEESTSGLKRIGISGLTKIWGMMCLGMLLYKLGIPQGKRSQRFYATIGGASLSIGILITAIGLAYNYYHAWQIDAYFRYGMTFKEIGSTFMTLGYICLIVLAYNQGVMNKFVNYVSSVGQMALTNYLTQSLLCALIFYGYGLGWYGAVTRLELIPIIATIWLVQISFSNLWLKYFKQGPVEWIWRILTYMRVGTIVKPR